MFFDSQFDLGRVRHTDVPSMSDRALSVSCLGD